MISEHYENLVSDSVERLSYTAKKLEKEHNLSEELAWKIAAEIDKTLSIEDLATQ